MCLSGTRDLTSSIDHTSSGGGYVSTSHLTIFTLQDEVGASHIDVNHEHWKRHTLQEAACKYLRRFWSPSLTFLPQAKTPSDADKYSQEAFDRLGDLAVG